MFDGSDSISNSQNIIDSREIIARIEYLNPFKVHAHADREWTGYEFKTREEAQEHIGSENNPAAFYVEEYGDESDELKALQAFADEAGNSADDWDHGATLVRESYWVRYAQEYARDVYGEDIENARWPLNCINWDEAAEELKVDYSEAKFDGVTYLVR